VDRYKRQDDATILREIATLEWVIRDRERQITSLVQTGDPEALATLMPNLTAFQTHDLGRKGALQWALGLSDVGPAAPRYNPRPSTSGL